MTKHQKTSAAILVPIVVALVGIWYFDPKNGKDSTKSASSDLKRTMPREATVGHLRAPASVPQLPLKTAVASVPAPAVWKENLEKTLKTQGGSFIKNIDIETVDSFNWKVGKVDVRVDSIKVSLQNGNGQRSSFRAIVDASSGKILQTWDQPIIDNFSAKNGGTVKIDSRYHHD